MGIKRVAGLTKKTYQSLSISARVLISTASTVSLLLLWIILFYVDHQERTILAQNERTMTLMVENMISALRTIMKAGYANIAQDFVADVRSNPNILEFQILRANGQEAFLDNTTINDVNRRLGEEDFFPREKESANPVLDSQDHDLRWVSEQLKLVSRYRQTEGKSRTLVYLVPILNDEKCARCHGKQQRMRGLVQVITSLNRVEQDILETRIQATSMATVSVLLLLLLLYLMIRYALVRPLGHLKGAMELVAGGRMDLSVNAPGGDEISEIARSFNKMTFKLNETYMGLRREQDKLSTIIFGALDGIIVTDGTQRVVLVNPSAERLLGKTADQIIADGWEKILDDPEYMLAMVKRQSRDIPDLVVFNQRAMKIHTNTLLDAGQRAIGTSFMLRDVTEEKMLEDKLRHLAITDALTQLYNRRFMDESLIKEVKRSQRYNHFLGFMLFDVDHFKKFNDTYGHDQGDRVLRAIGAQIKEHFRKVDLACRFGGEEFCVILPDTDPRGTYVVAERFRRRIERMVVDGLKVTVSVGIVILPACEVSKPEEMVKKADEALYDAKHRGRNQVCSAVPIDDVDLDELLD
ncbi:MAG: Sensor diguanylate cyclase [Magnetococcales bacterium]|nr:Sensor diguanylate cyclase [Magnetococcales bacterium]